MTFAIEFLETFDQISPLSTATQSTLIGTLRSIISNGFLLTRKDGEVRAAETNALIAKLRTSVTGDDLALQQVTPSNWQRLLGHHVIPRAIGLLVQALVIKQVDTLQLAPKVANKLLEEKENTRPITENEELITAVIRAFAFSFLQIQLPTILSAAPAFAKTKNKAQLQKSMQQFARGLVDNLLGVKSQPVSLASLWQFGQLYPVKSTEQTLESLASIAERMQATTNPLIENHRAALKTIGKPLTELDPARPRTSSMSAMLERLRFNRKPRTTSMDSAVSNLSTSSKASSQQTTPSASTTGSGILMFTEQKITETVLDAIAGGRLAAADPVIKPKTTSTC